MADLPVFFCPTQSPDKIESAPPTTVSTPALSSKPKMSSAIYNPETEVLRLMNGKKPMMFGGGHMLTLWRPTCDMLVRSLPEMFELGESYFYAHYAESKRLGKPITMSMTKSQFKATKDSFTSQGIVEMPSARENAKGIWCAFSHPKMKGQAVVARLSFNRFLGRCVVDETEPKAGDPSGVSYNPGLCPILFGLGIMADGITYVKADFSVVPLTDIYPDRQVVGLRTDVPTFVGAQAQGDVEDVFPSIVPKGKAKAKVSAGGGSANDLD